MSEDAPTFAPINGAELRFAVVAALFNTKLVDTLVSRAIETLLQAGVSREDIELVRVPGSNELPYAAAMLAKSGEFDGVIALGVVLEGETPHAQIIADSTGPALQRIAIDTEVPVINGILLVHNLAQAEARVAGKHDRGREFGQAALQMAVLKRALVERLDQLEAEREQAQGDDSGDGLKWKDFPGQSGKDPWKL